jgi:hypothetical protein
MYLVDFASHIQRALLSLEPVKQDGERNHGVRKHTEGYSVSYPPRLHETCPTGQKRVLPYRRIQSLFFFFEAWLMGTCTLQAVHERACGQAINVRNQIQSEQAW